MSDADTIKAVTVRLKGLPPDPEGANASRAKPAQIAVEAYKREKGLVDDGQHGLYDLLIDLRHWADRVGLDFEDTNTRSLECYTEEITPAP